MAKGKKKKKISLEEKLDKALEAIVDIIKRADVKDLAEVSIYGGLAWAGFQAPLLSGFPDALRLVWGPLALKLATTPAYGGEVSLGIGGVSLPVNSQVAGLTMLATLGFASVPWEDLFEKLKWKESEQEKIAEKFSIAYNSYESVMLHEEKDKLRRLWDNILISSVGFAGTDWQKAYAELENYIKLMTPIWQKRLEKADEDMLVYPKDEPPIHPEPPEYLPPHLR